MSIDALLAEIGGLIHTHPVAMIVVFVAGMLVGAVLLGGHGYRAARWGYGHYRRYRGYDY